MNHYRVGDKIFTNFAAAKRARKEIKASLPSDAIVTIYRLEECVPVVDDGHPSFMWVPYA